MRIVNLAHGSYFLLGGYVGPLGGAGARRASRWRCLAAAVAIALIGMGMERFFLRRLRGQTLGQVLMTIGFALIFQDLALLIWGGDPYTMPVPAAAAGLVQRRRARASRSTASSSWRVAVVVGAGAVAGAGPHARGRDDPRRGGRRRDGPGRGHQRAARSRWASSRWAPAWPRWAASIGGGFLGVYPGADFEMLPYAFVVVIVGGLGSLPGAMVGSLLVGLLDNFGKALFPELSYFTLFAPMALILALRPTGLFGRA